MQPRQSRAHQTGGEMSCRDIWALLQEKLQLLGHPSSTFWPMTVKTLTDIMATLRSRPTGLLYL